MNKPVHPWVCKKTIFTMRSTACSKCDDNGRIASSVIEPVPDRGPSKFVCRKLDTVEMQARVLFRMVGLPFTAVPQENQCYSCNKRFAAN